jgi:hypothetical protein
VNLRVVVASFAPMSHLGTNVKCHDVRYAAHRGRIVKTTGDGMLLEFASAVDAARCAAEVQRGMAVRNDVVPCDIRLEFRIGIHVGDIIFDDDDIFGDGVNIAARLEGIAEPGGACLSDDAYRQIRGKVEIACDDLGLQTLKNIAEPMRAWRIKLGRQAAATARPVSLAGQAPTLALPDKPSIAVLPFQNMSGDPEQEYVDFQMWQFWMATALATRCAGRFEESASWAAKVLQELPDFVTGLTSYAVSTALAGQIEEAQAAMSRALRLDPKIRLSNMSILTVLRRAEDRDNYCQGARLAGMPE